MNGIHTFRLPQLRRVGVAGIVLSLVVATLAGRAPAQQFGPPGQGGFGPPQGPMAMPLPGLVEASPAGLLRMQTVADELDLTPDQRDDVELVTRLLDQSLRSALDDLDFFGLMDAEESERDERIAKWQRTTQRASADADKELLKLLDAEQLARLEQLERQRAGAAALARADVIEALDLNAEQQAKLKPLLPPGAGEPPAFGPPAPRDEVTPEMLAVLTDAQRTAWDKLLGQAFEFPEPRQFFAGPGGPGFGGPGFGGPGFGGPGGGRGPGGPFAAERKMLAQFDANKDGWLNRDEREPALKWLADNPGGGRGGMFGPGGPGGSGNRRGRGPGGPGGFGRRTEPTSPGEKVAVADVPPVESADLYDAEVVRTLFLTFDSDKWEAELEAFHNTDVDVPATLTVDGREYKNVGVRFRGASSYMMLPAGSKRSLNVSLDLADPNQRLYGSKTLNLLNAHEDPTFMHTVLYSQIARKYVTSPKANFVRVVINGESWGLYTSAQQFDKLFIAENFPQDHDAEHTARWKVSGSPMASGGLQYFGDDVANYRSRFEIKSADDDRSWQALITLCRTLNETPTEELVAALEPMLDIDGVLRFLALDNALINSDGYWVRASDYSLYLDGAGRFHVFPHDMNEALQPAMGPGMGGAGGRGGRGGGRGGFGGGFGPPGFGGPGGFGGGPGGPPGMRGGAAGAEAYELDPLVGLDDPTKPLRSKLLAVPELREKYLAYVREIAENDLDWSKLGPVVENYAKLIRPVVERDTRKLSSLEEFDAALAEPEDRDEQVDRHNLPTFVQKRQAYLLKAIDAHGTHQARR
jgi:spore coat protein CotH